MSDHPALGQIAFAPLRGPESKRKPHTPERKAKVLSGLEKARTAAAEKRKQAEPDEWIGGRGPYVICKQQFQVIYDFYGGLALDFYEDFLVWPDQRRPEHSKVHDWCKEVDEGTANIPDVIREAVTRRLASFVRGEAIATQRASGRLVRKIADAVVAELEKPEPSATKLAMLKDLSGIYQHSIVGTSFLTKELIPRQEQQAVQYQMNNVKIITNRAPHVRKDYLRKLAQPVKPAIEAEYTES